MLKGGKGHSDALNYAERILNVEVVNLGASLCEDKKMLVLALKAICYHKVLYA